ncbi:MAG: nucleotide pyrophosphohydrolase [Bdellovibrionaceae bacterium]|nr:nucleotide pyrophosphohydrolase [Bdellovibrionales bacterium]MCB9084233.1 nucleotide pyrophosphohydrolase [Pseudobdellovibrionaceae bacterium]
MEQNWRKWTEKVQAFCEARDWDQYHGPKDLAIGLVTEATELLEIFRFKNDDQSKALLQHPKQREYVADELADTLFFLLRFAQRNDFDLGQALDQKMAKNAIRYPVEKAHGKNDKYDQL